MTEAAAARYVAWLVRHGRAILIAAAAAVAASIYLAAFHLPLHADLSDLLPEGTPAIRDLHRLEARIAAKDTMVAIVTAPDPDRRAAAAADLAAETSRLDPSLVARVDHDDGGELRAFVIAHAALYVPLSELVDAERALSKRIADAKLRANPLYIDLDDDRDAGSLTDTRALDDLRARRRDAEAHLARSAQLSADGRTQVIVIATAFRATDASAGGALLRSLDAIASRVRTRHPAVAIEFAGGVPQTLAEHDSLVAGMLASSLFTAVLVALVLLVHLRSLRALVLLIGNITAATVIAFGSAALSVGHLNAATAFLGAIIAGNGINYGILLLARFLDERRAHDARAAMALAIAGTVRPTLIASLGAAIAYGALAATQFRGFADFAVIGGIGMLVCWIASFTVLPVLVLRQMPSRPVALTLHVATSLAAPTSSPFGRLAAALFGFRRPAVVCAVAATIALASSAITARYLTRDPFEYDMTQLRSDAPAALALRARMAYVNQTFGRGLSGMSRSTYVALDDTADAPAVVAALRATAAREPLIGAVQSIADAVPPDQPAKLRVLSQIRRELDEAASTLPVADQRDLAELRPPDDLHAFTAADLPTALRARLTERDGRIGALVAVSPSAAFDEWDGHHLLRFAAAIRDLHLANRSVTASGPSMIFADILTTIRCDGAIVTACAAAALAAMVLLLVGRNRRAAAVLSATALGSMSMIAACASIGLKVNFLDFVALPIALGLGIDYAINLAEHAEQVSPREALRTTGGSVLVCSLTTMIGYASLLVSSNLAIRGFGLASLIGEITCAAAALALVPAICSRRRGAASTTIASANQLLPEPR